MLVCCPTFPTMRPEEFPPRNPLWSTMMKVFPSGNGHPDRKQADGNNSGRLALSPPVLLCPPLLLGHRLMVTSLLDWHQVIIWPMKDGDGKRTFKFGPTVSIGFKHEVSFLFRSCNHTDFFPLHIEQNPPNPPQQDSPVPCMLREQAPWQPTPGPSGTQWSEDLSHEPSQHNEPPIPGLSASSKLPEDVLSCEPEPEVASTQSMEKPLACPAPPCSVIFINDTPVGSPHLRLRHLPPNAKLPSFP
ncbi:hypothetical protein O181_042337 [Austropuccinia psidii MF-1]|uniref:Uncharacterized protein n=1 Tax=Austropuccinia psidii MF-1 TaxID=1389203 RepID=A0A9Q3DMN5_9BASI|nr:hypothetical protein [Austropuccinia psidii MF-1]